MKLQFILNFTSVYLKKQFFTELSGKVERGVGWIT